jgi:hypothetical protein
MGLPTTMNFSRFFSFSIYFSWAEYEIRVYFLFENHLPRRAHLSFDVSIGATPFFPTQDAEQSSKLDADRPSRFRCLGSPAHEPRRATTLGRHAVLAIYPHTGEAHCHLR